MPAWRIERLTMYAIIRTVAAQAPPRREALASVLVLVADLESQLFGEQQLRSLHHDLVAGREVGRVEPSFRHRLRRRHLPAQERVALPLHVDPGLPAVPHHGR